ncbi:MAG: hypothetical protein RMY64_13430 [Nostoc sp. DedQUE08]|nr:hypothetical protein [Nostoc sp. DedSLP04]MDZ8035948.1 hypothetical protein [Nostoc sp. DedSLP04]MDZ8066600.1 hypothetical protein [Nostoc sp. DedQUE08]
MDLLGCDRTLPATSKMIQVKGFNSIGGFILDLDLVRFGSSPLAADN